MKTLFQNPQSLSGLKRPVAVSTEPAGAQMEELSAKTPAQLFEQCAAAEREAYRDLDPIKVFFTKWLIFGPLFEPEPVVSNASAINKDLALKIRRQLWQGGKYRDILEFLRGCANREERLFRFARWLKQENVCEPEDILGAEELRKVARKNFYFFSESEFNHANRVWAWLPYFKLLLASVNNKNVAELVQMGYKRTAIEEARRKRSAVEAACAWLESRGAGNALTLKNAYSKVYGPKRLQRHGYTLEDSRS